MINRSLTSTLDRMLTLNRALDQAFSGALGEPGTRLWVPAVDVVEKNDAYLIACELPGVDASQVDISFEQNVLTIRGTKTAGFEAAGEVRVYAAERVSGAFERAVRLPEFVDGDHISAELRNGLLTITVPKAQAAQPRKITINALGNVENVEQVAN